MSTIEAIYEDGVFRPRNAVDLEDGSCVELELKKVHAPGIAEVKWERHPVSELEAEVLQALDSARRLDLEELSKRLAWVLNLLKTPAERIKLDRAEVEGAVRNLIESGYVTVVSEPASPERYRITVMGLVVATLEGREREARRRPRRRVRIKASPPSRGSIIWSGEPHRSCSWRMEMGINVDSRLHADTEVYRFISFETFLSFLETEKTYLTNINEWPDKWEAIIAKVPVVDEHGRPRKRSYSSHQEAVAQSWSLAGETDALWRILRTVTALREQVDGLGVPDCSASAAPGAYDDRLEKSLSKPGSPLPPNMPAKNVSEETTTVCATSNCSLLSKVKTITPRKMRHAPPTARLIPGGAGGTGGSARLAVPGEVIAPPSKGSSEDELSLSFPIGGAVKTAVKECEGKLVHRVYQKGEAAVFAIEFYAAEPAGVVGLDVVLILAHEAHGLSICHWIVD
jgi:predicted DNA-binding antitoxin AbrB/MazE fold protein